MRFGAGNTAHAGDGGESRLVIETGSILTNQPVRVDLSVQTIQHQILSSGDKLDDLSAKVREPRVLFPVVGGQDTLNVPVRRALQPRGTSPPVELPLHIHSLVKVKVLEDLRENRLGIILVGQLPHVRLHRLDDCFHSLRRAVILLRDGL